MKKVATKETPVPTFPAAPAPTPRPRLPGPSHSTRGLLRPRAPVPTWSLYSQVMIASRTLKEKYARVAEGSPRSEYEGERGGEMRQWGLELEGVGGGRGGREWERQSEGEGEGGMVFVNPSTSGFY
ncbi:unnamed protein product [Pleuronectes platessa]|uniref:Uncharacterized protein n=1 Tax=Pleuronectes platessa TaxID=8262 RepID=A0A9N7VIB1_PLEPL|nr:unnamed protein product [Pleuronectes platessa]